MNKFLIVGLGNIGAEYAGTRHNIGFDVADALAVKHSASWRTDRLADITEFKLKGKFIFCIKPNTYMNLSGKAVKYWKDKENIETANIMVVVDDVALPLEKIRIRPSGSHGGHNGLKSLEEYLLTEEYAKLRFGVGNDYLRGQQADYVLGKWRPSELPVVGKKCEICVEVLETFVLRGITTSMNEYNKITVTL